MLEERPSPAAAVKMKAARKSQPRGGGTTISSWGETSPAWWLRKRPLRTGAPEVANPKTGRTGRWKNQLKNRSPSDDLQTGVTDSFRHVSSKPQGLLAFIPSAEAFSLWYFVKSRVYEQMLVNSLMIKILRLRGSFLPPEGCQVNTPTFNRRSSC